MLALTTREYVDECLNKRGSQPPLGQRTQTHPVLGHRTQTHPVWCNFMQIRVGPVEQQGKKVQQQQKHVAAVHHRPH